MKNAFLIISFSLLFTGLAKAGCGGVCISTVPTHIPNVYSVNDTVYIAPNGNGQTTLYAIYDDCCNSLFSGNVSIIWARNGLAIDTTNSWTVSNFFYTQQLTVAQPGVYTVYFYNFFYPNNPSYICGTVTVLLQDQAGQLNAVLPAGTAADPSISIFPNPAGRVIQLGASFSKPGHLSVQVFSATGKLCFSSEEQVAAGEFKKAIDISTLPDGIYLVKMESPLGIETRRIIHSGAQ